MSISTALNAGISGLNANATQIATISDNIANSQTNGYKRAETDFNSLVIDSSTGYSAGGVQTSTSRAISDQGPLISTGSATDIAVTGRGMLPTTREADLGAQGTPPLLLASTGSFSTNEDGFLVTESGLALNGVRADRNGAVPGFPRGTTASLEPVRVNRNQLAGDPTTEMTITANLPATGTVAGASGNAQTLQVEYFDNLGQSESLDVSFTPTVPAAGSSNEWTMSISDSAAGGAVVGEYTLTFDASRAAGGTLQNVATLAGGAYDPVTGTVDVTTASGPIEIDIGTPGDPQGMSQLSDTFTPVDIDKNGSAVGNLTDVEIDESGMVRAIYDNGTSRVIYQIPLVDVPNPDGLTTQDDQTYTVSPESGPFRLRDAGDGPTGEIRPSALEGSATELSAELTQMIETQRAYSSNATVIQTVDEMLQETTNLKR